MLIENSECVRWAWSTLEDKLAALAPFLPPSQWKNIIIMREESFVLRSYQPHSVPSSYPEACSDSLQQEFQCTLRVWAFSMLPVLLHHLTQFFSIVKHSHSTTSHPNFALLLTSTLSLFHFQVWNPSGTPSVLWPPFH